MVKRFEQSGGEAELEAPQKRSRRIAKGVGRFAARATVISTLGFATAAGLSTIVPTEVPFGPGTGRAVVTLDSKATLETGLVGSARRPIDGPSAGPIDFGITVRTNEIPTGHVDTSPPPVEDLTVDSLFDNINDEDIAQYGELYRSVSREGDEITSALREHFLRLFIGSSAVYAGLYLTPGKRGRREIASQLRHRWPVLIVCPVIAAGCYISAPKNDVHTWAKVGSEYNNTPLEGVEISGDPLTRLVNDFGGRIMRYVRETDEFYDRAKESTGKKLGHLTLLGQRPQDEPYETILFFSDNHCNTGTPKILAQVGAEAGASIAVDAGDTVFSGTGYEAYCVEQQQRAFHHQDIIVVQAPGNHDSPLTSAAMEDNGAIVLGGEPTEVQGSVGGITFLGDADPRQSTAGQTISYRGTETLDSLGHRLAKGACDTEGPVILVVHDKRAADEALQAGCTDLSLSGHTHREEVVTASRDDAGLAFRVTGGSAGGAEENHLTYGPLQADAHFMLLSINPETGRLMAQQSLAITTEGQFAADTITDYQQPG